MTFCFPIFPQAESVVLQTLMLGHQALGPLGLLGVARHTTEQGCESLTTACLFVASLEALQ